jgi:hypothetical protein
LFDPRYKFIRIIIEEFAVQLQAAGKALEEESDPDILLTHIRAARDLGRIETLRRALRDRSLELFEERKRKR